MKKIHKLPDHIVAQIAAGEVIERPAYAVKELIENAIDAKATSISIHIDQAVLKKIVVSDNGEGMSREDIQECFKPHTTSKISINDTLTAIKSLGFRGEALSSITAMSDMIIISKPKNAIAGTAITVHNGTVEKIQPIGTPSGTSISITNLFASVPARKKFLKSSQTEFRHIVEVVTNFAIAYPRVDFALTHNKRSVLNVQRTNEQLQRLQTLLGNHLVSFLLPINYKNSYIHLSGFLAKPQITTISKQKQFLFVNRRSVKDKLISLAVKESYGNVIDKASQPVFLLMITVPFEFVDVNIHPRKEQVSFVNNQIMYETIQKAVKQTLLDHNITFSNTYLENIYERNGLTKSYAGNLLRDAVLSNEKLGIDTSSKILQINKLYLICPTQSGFVLIDQHAAHERILYEKLLHAFLEEKKKKQIYKLAKPITWSVSLSDAEIIQEYLTFFANVGFSLKKIHPNSFSISSVPMLFKDRNLYSLIAEMIADIACGKLPKTIDEQTNLMLSYLACRAAIKAGDTITQQDCEKLITNLENTDNNATCPHGRPTKIPVTLRELNILFRRT